MNDYRPLGDDHREAFATYTGYAFVPEAGPVEYDPEEHDTARMELGDRRGLFAPDATADDRPLCVCVHHWFDAHVRDDRHSTPGLSMVASPPDHRREGNVERLLVRSLEEYRERGDRFSILWPFRYRFYRQYGWETCTDRPRYSCPPEALSFAADATGDGGRYRPIDADEYDALVPIYDHHASQYALAVDRDEDWWRHRIFESWETDPYVYAWERDGDVRGYVVYTIPGEWDDRTLQVRELGYLDTEALLAMLGFCANHDSQVEEVRFTLPPTDRLHDLVPDPEDVDLSLETGVMARIVDVAETLSVLSYPDLDAVVTLEIEDSFAAWNDGRFTLSVTDGEPTCERSTAIDDPDVTLDVGTLTQLAVGYRSADALNRMGQLEASPDAVEDLARLFPPDDVYLATGF